MNDVHELIRQIRRILEKTRDLEFANKVDRIFSKRNQNQSQPLIVVCLENLIGYINCCLSSTNNNKLQQLKASFIQTITTLIAKISSKASLEVGSKRKLKSRYITNAIRSYKKLSDEMYKSQTGIKECYEEWGATINTAVSIWGNQI